MRLKCQRYRVQLTDKTLQYPICLLKTILMNCFEVTSLNKKLRHIFDRVQYG